jgi:hypothetical protein
MNLRSAALQAYYRIGIHTAPPGTLFHFLHTTFRGLARVGTPREVSRDAMVRSPYGGTPWYAIDRARRSRQVDGLALIFFMGVGDYLMATSMLEALRLAHPDLPIYAFASSNSDAANSPLVVNLLRNNPAIDKVFTYRGRPGYRWPDYDYRDVLPEVPENFLILPVTYETLPRIVHRETTLFETFGLPVMLPVTGPRLQTGTPLTPSAEAILAQINARLGHTTARSVVSCHLDSRSSGYVYPEIKKLLNGLLAEGCLVVYFGQSGIEGAADLIEVDVTTITLSDTISLLHNLKNGPLPLRFVSVNSLMWPISAGLGVPNLGLHVFFDESIHQYLYPNIFVISQHLYSRVSPSRLFQAPHYVHKQRRAVIGVEFTDYQPDFVIDCFRRFLELN